MKKHMKDYIEGRLSDFAKKFGITNEQATHILYNVSEVKDMWNIVELDEFLFEKINSNYKLQ